MKVQFGWDVEEGKLENHWIIELFPEDLETHSSNNQAEQSETTGKHPEEGDGSEVSKRSRIVCHAFISGTDMN